jgi:PAS domain S-box-containing protein
MPLPDWKHAPLSIRAITALVAYGCAVAMLGALGAGAIAARTASLRLAEDLGTLSIQGKLSSSALALRLGETLEIGAATEPRRLAASPPLRDVASADLASRVGCDFGLVAALFASRWTIVCGEGAVDGNAAGTLGVPVIRLSLASTRLRSPVLLAAATGAGVATIAALMSLWIARRLWRRMDDVWPSILDEAGVATWIVDVRSDLLQTNECWNRMLGYTRATAPATLRAATDLIHPDDPSRIQEALVAAGARNTSPAFADEFRMLRGDGSYRWLLSRATVVAPKLWIGQGRLVGINADIEDRKLAETDSLRRTAFLMSVLSSLSSQVAVLDSGGCILLTNDAWAAFSCEHGSLAVRPCQGDNYLECLSDISGPDRAIAKALWSGLRHLLDGDSAPIEKEYKASRAGKEFVFSLRAQAFNVPDGRRVTIVNHDVTEVRAAEKQVQESEKRLRFIVERSGDSIWEVDVPSGAVTRSPQLAAILGLAGSDELGPDSPSFFRRVHPDDIQRTLAAYESVLRGDTDTCAIEQRLQHADGTWRWLMTRICSVSRDEQGRAVRVVGVHSDISQLKEVEAVLRAQANDIRMLAKVAEHTTNAVLIVSAQNSIEWVNRGFEKYTGFALEEVLGKTPVEVLHGPDTDAEVAKTIEDRLIAGHSVHVRILHYRKDGTPFWSALEVQPVTASDGTLEHFVAVIEDLTHRERLEADLRLSQKLESVGQLAAGIAHEINTPIQFIGDSVTFLAEAWRDVERLVDGTRGGVALGMTAGEPPDDTVRNNIDTSFILENFPEAIARARDGVRRVSDIVRAMKEFAHPAHGHFSGADLNHAIGNALVVSRNELKYSGSAHFDGGDIPSVTCRIGSINQVLLNLIVNAAHALADARHTPETGQLTVRTRVEDGWVVVAISDNGAGIPDAIRERIFDPFFTTKEVGRGTGQGLAIARAIVVDQHGGRITVDSHEGAGTTFEVWLPIDGPSTGGVEPLPASAA